MNPTDTRLPDIFPLNTLGAALQKLRPPQGPFAAAGPWKHTWGVYTTAARLQRVGTLMLRRRVGEQGRVALEMEYEKTLSGGVQKIDAAMHLDADSRLSTPVRWQWQARVLTPSGKLVANTRLEKSAAFDSGWVTVSDKSGKQLIEMPGPYTLNWALFDAVTRLPGETFDPLCFTLIDHFDQPKPGQTLSYRKTTDVPIGGRTVRLRAFDQLGQGIVPWVYWLDEQGRLLAAVSGLEAYLIETTS